MLKRLRLLREEAGLSQKAVAQIIGVSQQSINKYENHNIEPDIETLIALADCFHVSVDYLIGRNDTENASDHDAPFLPDAEEVELLRKYRKLRPGQKESIRMVIENY